MIIAVTEKGEKMAKYIKTDAIVDKVCEGISCNECSFGTNEDGMSECVLQKRIDGLPTADVVEVVRCRDCTWWKSIFSCLNLLTTGFLYLILKFFFISSSACSGSTSPTTSVIIFEGV